MRYVEFTQSQDIHHLLACMVHSFRYFRGLTETVLTLTLWIAATRPSGPGPAAGTPVRARRALRTDPRSQGDFPVPIWPDIVERRFGITSEWPDDNSSSDPIPTLPIPVLARSDAILSLLNAATSSTALKAEKASP
jgi:hypothetical protein